MISMLMVLALVQEPLAPIVVKATPASVLPTASLDSVTLRRDVRPSLAVVAAEMPGVRAVTTGAIITKPMIRGLSGARVLTVDNGSRLEDYSWSDEDGPSIDPRLSERIEVIRGPASLLYGSDAIGGVVNSIPEALPIAAPGERFRRLRTEIFGSTNNPGFGAGANAAWARNAWSARLNVVGHFAGPISTPAGELENTGFSSLNGEAAIGVHGATSRASLRISRFAGEFKLLEADAPAAPPPGGQEGGPERKVDDIRVQLAGQTLWHGLSLEARGQLEHHGTIELSDGATPGVETETINLALTTGTLELLANHRYGTVGISTMLQDNKSTGAERLVPNASMRRAAIFAVGRFPAGRATFLAGARADVLSGNHSALTGDVGMTFEMARGLTIAANVGRAYRAASLFELYSDGPRPGEDRYEVGDSTMVPEVSLNVDAGLRWHFARVRGELAAFHNRIDHFIYITPTGQYRQTGTPANPDSLREFQYGQAQATLAGGEASLEIDATDHLTASVRADYVKGDNDTRGRPLPLIPPMRVVIGARFHQPHWYAGVEAEAVSRQNRTSQFDVPTSGYTLLDLEGGTRLHLGTHLLFIDARLRNALNKAYRNYLNRYKEFALDAGRSIEVRVATEF